MSLYVVGHRCIVVAEKSANAQTEYLSAQTKHRQMAVGVTNYESREK